MTATVARLLDASGLPMIEARALLAHRLGVTRERLVAHPETDVAAADAAAFDALAQRRKAGEPLAYLLGEKEFHGRPFGVTPDVLVPRPETELLVDLALARMRGRQHPRVLDLGTGSGCIAVTLALECPAARVTAVDVSGAALAVARRNAARLGATVTFLPGSWYAALPPGERFDVVVANPPYIAPGDPHLADLRFEPVDALTDGRDGLACIEAIVAGARDRLLPGGWLLVEHGYDQADEVQAIFSRRGFTGRLEVDGAGHPRVTFALRGPDMPMLR